MAFAALPLIGWFMTFDVQFLIFSLSPEHLRHRQT